MTALFLAAVRKCRAQNQCTKTPKPMGDFRRYQPSLLCCSKMTPHSLLSRSVLPLLTAGAKYLPADAHGLLMLTRTPHYARFSFNYRTMSPKTTYFSSLPIYLFFFLIYWLVITFYKALHHTEWHKAKQDHVVQLEINCNWFFKVRVSQSTSEYYRTLPRSSKRRHNFSSKWRCVTARGTDLEEQP